MADLSLKVGALTRTLTAPDAPATEILALYLSATGGPESGTNAEKFDWVLQRLRDHMVGVAQSEKRNQALRTADAGVAPIVWGA